MKNTTKKYIIFIMVICVCFLLTHFALAADPVVSFKPEIGLGGDFKAGVNYKVDGLTIGKVLISIYKYGIGIMGVLATVVMMLGGLKWMTSAGDSSKVGEAQKMITSSILGVVLALSAYLILATVNTNLTKTFNLNLTQIKDISKKPFDLDTQSAIGCCTVRVENGYSYSLANQSLCDLKKGVFAQGKTLNEAGDGCMDNSAVCTNKPDFEKVYKSYGPGYCIKGEWRACLGQGQNLIYEDINIKKSAILQLMALDNNGANNMCCDGLVAKKWITGMQDELYCGATSETEDRKKSCDSDKEEEMCVRQDRDGYCENNTCLTCKGSGDPCTEDYQCCRAPGRDCYGNSKAEKLAIIHVKGLDYVIEPKCE